MTGTAEEHQVRRDVDPHGTECGLESIRIDEASIVMARGVGLESIGIDEALIVMARDRAGCCGFGGLGWGSGLWGFEDEVGPEEDG